MAAIVMRQGTKFIFLVSRFFPINFAVTLLANLESFLIS